MKYFGKHFHSSILVFVMFLLVGLACNLSNQVDSVSLTSTIANVVTEQEPLKVDTATPEPTQPQQLPTTTNQPTQIPSPTTPIMEITTPETTSQLEGVLWPQWASSAYASSEFDNPDWSASQIIGEPDTLECGDYSSAWASFDLTQEEYIEVMFGAYVFPLELHIYQSYFPNQVIRVQLIDYDFNYIDIYEGIPETVDACPFILTIPITIDPDIAVQGARITLDQSGLSGSQRNEIDAIELIGWVGYDDPVLNPNQLLGVSPYELSSGQFYAEIADQNLAITGSTITNEQDESGYTVTMTATDEEGRQFTITFYLPLDVQIGIHELQPNMFTGEEDVVPSSSLMIDDRFYNGIGGSLILSDIVDGKMIGWFSFNASLDSESVDETIYITGALMEIPFVPSNFQ